MTSLGTEVYVVTASIGGEQTPVIVGVYLSEPNQEWLLDKQAELRKVHGAKLDCIGVLASQIREFEPVSYDSPEQAAEAITKAAWMEEQLHKARVKIFEEQQDQ